MAQLFKKMSYLDSVRHSAKKKLYIESGSWMTTRPKPKTKIKINLGLDLEFYSIHFGKEINNFF